MPTDGQPTGTFTGTVTASESGRPFAGAQVSAEGTPRRAITDARGRYHLPIEPGTYTLQATALNRQSERRQASVTAGGTTTVDLVIDTSGIEGDPS